MLLVKPFGAGRRCGFESSDAEITARSRHLRPTTEYTYRVRAYNNYYTDYDKSRVNNNIEYDILTP